MAGLRAAADGCFAAARALANAAFIPAGRGKVVLLAPDDRPTAAALENTARTLSIEWARHGIVITCVHTRARSDALVAFLCSPAGDYYSGLRLRRSLSGCTRAVPQASLGRAGDGSVTVAFRYWRRPTVKAGGTQSRRPACSRSTPSSASR